MSAPDLPFTQQDLRRAIPDRCFEPNLWRSMAYLVFDLAVIAGLYAILAQTSLWYIEWPVIFLIGTMLWSLFVIGHDAGHARPIRDPTQKSFQRHSVSADRLH